MSGTLVSLPPSGTQVIIGTSTIPISPASILPPPLVIGSQTFTANSASAYVIAGQTLVPGQPGLNVPGSAIGILTPASEALPTPITVGSQVFTPNPTGFEVAGTTISAGGPGVTIAGTPVLLETSGKLVIGTSTTELASAGVLLAPLTVGGQFFTPNPTAFSIAGTTISAGGPGITISGTPVSLGSSGNLVIGGSTTELSPTTNSTTGVLGFTGRASLKSVERSSELLALMLLVAMVL